MDASKQKILIGEENNTRPEEISVLLKIMHPDFIYNLPLYSFFHQLSNAHKKIFNTTEKASQK